MSSRGSDLRRSCFLLISALICSALSSASFAAVSSRVKLAEGTSISVPGELSEVSLSKDSQSPVGRLRMAGEIVTLVGSFCQIAVFEIDGPSVATVRSRNLSLRSVDGDAKKIANKVIDACRDKSAGEGLVKVIRGFLDPADRNSADLAREESRDGQFVVLAPSSLRVNSTLEILRRDYKPKFSQFDAELSATEVVLYFDGEEIETIEISEYSDRWLIDAVGEQLKSDQLSASVQSEPDEGSQRPDAARSGRRFSLSGGRGKKERETTDSDEAARS